MAWDEATAAPGARFTIARIGSDDPRHDPARDLRYDVLYRPWGLSRTLVDDTDGRTYVHFVAEDDSCRVVGYARLHVEGGECRVYQVAVADDWRGRGVGRALMSSVACEARANGRDFIELDSRETAIGFYERLGYTVVSETFLSGRTGTPHRTVRRGL